jgi:hypothetical protein
VALLAHGEHDAVEADALVAVGVAVGEILVRVQPSLDQVLTKPEAKP